MLTFNKPTFLGIDFGMSHIKAVELTIKNDRPYLINYGEAAMNPSSVQDSGVQYQGKDPEDKAQSLLLALLQKMTPKSKEAYVALPGFSGLITIIELPKMNKAEIETAIRFEAQKYIPSPLDEVVLSWDTVSNQSYKKIPSEPVASVSGEAETVEILLVAALHKEVEKYERYITASTLKMEMLELEMFSLVRALVTENSKTVLIVDIGARSTNLILVDNGFIKINRNLNAGGHEITVTLSEALKVTPERADMMKTSDTDFLNSHESSIVLPSLELSISESRRMINAYQEKHKESHVDAVILSGGTSAMKGLDTYFSKALGIPVSIGDPWKNIDHDEKLRDIIPKLGSSYAVAIGLALAGIEAYDRR